MVHSKSLALHSTSNPSVWMHALGITTVVLATTVGAWLRVPLPFTPVPVTLQTLMVILGAAFLGRNSGGIAQIAYVSLGCAGLPIFAGAATFGTFLFGPTGGYLIGFIAAAFIVGHAVERDKVSVGYLVTVFFLAGLLILALGTLQLKVWTGVTFTQAAMMGAVPFLGGLVAKTAVAVAVYRPLHATARRWF